MKDNMAYLRIVSWIGKVPNASHYYGDIILGNYRYETRVERKLTKTEAAGLNRNEKLKYENPIIKYIEGEKSPFFLDRDSLIRAAKKIYRKECIPLGAIALVVGNRALMEPQPIACVTYPIVHKEIMKRINELAKEREELDTRYSEYHEHEGASDMWREDYDKMMKEWQPLFEQLENG